MSKPAGILRFPCPLGHLLEADEADAGQPLRCPTCGAHTVVPGPTAERLGAGPPLTAPPIQVAPPSETQPFAHEMVAQPPAPVIETAANEPAPPIDPLAESKPEVLHIPCPNKHELETPLDMLGEYVMCPECEAQFRLREEDSVEHRQRKQMEQEARERRLAKAWMNWAIMTTVFVVLGVLLLLIASSR